MNVNFDENVNFNENMNFDEYVNFNENMNFDENCEFQKIRISKKNLTCDNFENKYSNLFDKRQIFEIRTTDAQVQNVNSFHDCVIEGV